MRGRNLQEVIVGHLQRALISYLETLSVMQLDRQESSLTWMAYVSLNRHAFMYTASPCSLSVTPNYTAHALLFFLRFHPRTIGHFCTELPLLSRSPSCHFPL